MKKWIAMLLAVCMLFSLCACGGTSDASAAASADSGTTAPEGDVYTVSIQFTFPEESAAGAQQVMAAIEEESGGRIKFEPYYSYSFVENSDVVEALETNQLDIAGLMPAEYSIFPLNGHMCSLPLLNYPSWEAASQIYLSMVYNNQDMMKEFTDHGMVFWGGYMCPGYQFFSTKEISDPTPEMFSGLTIMCDNAEMQSFINQNNGGANSVFPTEYLSSLQNGVADALVQHVNCAYVFGCFDYVKTAIFFGEGGFYNLPLAYCFSETFWNNLPEDLQDIFAAHASELSKASHDSDNALYSNVALPSLKEKATVVTLDDAQIAQWQEAAAPIVDSAMDSISADSPNAASAYEQLKEMIASYDAETFQIGTNNFGLEAVWE